MNQLEEKKRKMLYDIMLAEQIHGKKERKKKMDMLSDVMLDVLVIW